MFLKRSLWLCTDCISARRDHSDCHSVETGSALTRSFGRLAKFKPFHPAKEKGLISAVIKFGQDDRTANRESILILTVRCHTLEERVAGIEYIVADKLPKAAM